MRHILLAAFATSLIAGILCTPANAAGEKACTSFVASSDERDRIVEYIDLGATGPSAGDRRVGRAAVFDSDGKEIGYKVWTITIVEVEGDKPVAIVGQQQHILTDGSLFSLITAGYQGDYQQEDKPTITDSEKPVIGGTGAYAGARGTATQKFEGVAETTTFNLICE